MTTQTTTMERIETGIEPITMPTQEQITAVRALLDTIGARDAAKAAAPNENVSAAVTTRASRKKRSLERRPQMTVLQAVPTTGHNAPTFAELLVSCAELGEQAGKGKDVQIKFDLKIVEAAYLGSLSLDENKHGTGIDDATKLTEAYVKAQQGAVIFDAKADNQRKTISNVRKAIKLGSCPKWGQGEPMGRVNDLITLRQDMKRKGMKVVDAHNTFTRYATAQLRRDTLIADDELKTFCVKKGVEARTGEDLLEGVRKLMNKLKGGTVPNCPDMDNSAEVQAIINACTKRLTAIAKARAPQGGTAPATP